METFIEFLKGFNFQNIVAMFVICWYFARATKTDMKASEARLEEQVKTQTARCDRLYEMIAEINKEK